MCVFISLTADILIGLYFIYLFTFFIIEFHWKGNQSLEEKINELLIIDGNDLSMTIDVGE